MYTSTNYPEEIEDESAKGWYGSIQVSVRVRPVLERQEHKRIGSRNLGPPAPDLAGEMNKNRALATSAWRSSSSMSTASPYVKWKWTPNSISHFEIDGGASVLRFPCHRVFAPTDATESVFSDVVLPLVNGMLRQGLDSCVFTYGQTNSGKTYTTFGTERQPGIVPRTAERIFSYIRDEMEPGTHALLRLSLFEVYNEIVRDLLVEGTPSLTPHDHPTAEVTLTGASEHFVTSVEDLLTLVAHGQKQRTSATNNVHEHASRSHCIVRLIFEHSDQQLSKGLTRRWSQHYANSPYGAIDVGGPNTTLASIYLVDLAGSEANYFSVSSRASEMQAVTDRKELLNIAQQAQGTLENMRKETHTRMVEGSNIRRSLLALQRCIAIRAQQYYSDTQTGGTHVPYRESKLTRILRHALCGRCATVLICTVDPTEEKETLATLRFASTAQKVHVMQQSSKEVLHSVLHEYQEEIDGLRNEMEERNALHDQSVRQMITQANNKLNELSGKKTQVHAEEQSLQDQYEKLMRHLIPAGTSSHDHINVKRSNPSNPSRQRRRASIPMSQSELAKNQTARARQQTLYNQQHRKVIGDCTTSMSCGVIVPLLAEHLIKQWEYPIPVADFCKDGGSAIVRDGVQYSTQYTAQAQKDAEEERQQLLTILRTLDAGPMLDSLLLNSIQDDNTHGKVCPSEDISIGRDNECEKQMCEREENMRRLLQEKEDVRLEEEYLALQDLYLHVGRGNLALEEAIQRTVTFRAPGICGGSKPPLMREQDFLLPVDQFKQKHTVEFEPAPMRS